MYQLKWPSTKLNEMYMKYKSDQEYNMSGNTARRSITLRSHTRMTGSKKTSKFGENLEKDEV